MKRFVTIAFAIALVAAACGGDDAADTTTTTAAPTTTTTAAPTTTTTAATTTTTSTTTTFPVNPQISPSDTVTTGGLGPVRIGMNPQEANIAAGYNLPVDPNSLDNACYYLLGDPVLENVGFMVNDGTIARVDIGPGSDITTRSGARIGMTESQIIDLFGDKIQPRAHPFVTGGKYLEFVPVDEVDKNFRVIFETDATGIVTSYRAGRLPEVGWIEGCL